ncbi:selenium cofactor biosynthesis protein YqeC [Desulfonatronum thioautotrophicum]|uniref:selenium cofactor biosynthesis protein YqeC n=1 Tax=Desulfonatronum thioautotrophicum TaxID=617001 RepID=UPI0005EAE53A|nr:selenium cofactor biosynthesis protein YqeC [Desulfonatronum thioautotrophicum]
MILNTPDELYLPDATVVALVGAGGKTSLMTAMAAHALRRGETVIRTTTTKLAATTTEPVFWDGRNLSLPRLQAHLRHGNLQNRSMTLVRDRDTATGKLLGLAPEAVDLLAGSGLADRIFVEADGARGKVIKAPANHEPVIPHSTNLVIGIVGADALGVPMVNEHVFRPERLAALCDALPIAAVDACVLARLVGHPQGLFKNAPASPCRRLVFVNKMEKAGEAAWDLLRHARKLVKAAQPNGQRCATPWFAGSVHEGWVRSVDGN